MKVYFSMSISGHDLQERMNYAESAKAALLNMYDDVVTPFDACPYDPNKSYGNCICRIKKYSFISKNIQK